jgi:methionyl-tRNA formyltransferase
LKEAACAVKVAALDLGLPVYQPHKVRDGALAEWLLARQADLGVVLAYGRILPEAVLNAPKHGCINLHASLLPRHRGAAPIQWALMNGDLETGISLMQMDAGLDTGPVYERRSIPISERMNAGQLAELLAALAAQVVATGLSRVLEGARPEPQRDEMATHAPPIGPEHVLMDWERPARALHNQVRALSPRPGAHTWLGGKRLRILESWYASSPDDSSGNSEGLRDREHASSMAGRVIAASGDSLWVATGEGALQILVAQLEGKRALTARDLINGRSLEKGVRLGQ